MVALINAILKFQSTTSVLCRSTSTIACANNNTSSSFSPLSNFSSAASIEAEKAVTNGPRYDWTRPPIQSVYDSPLMDLLFHGILAIAPWCAMGTPKKHVRWLRENISVFS